MSHIFFMACNSVEFDQENIVDEGIDNLFHDFGHSNKENSINDGVNHTKGDYKPVQVKMYGLDRHPHSKTDFVTLTVDPPVAQEEPVPLSATQTHGEAGINRKKPNKLHKFILGSSSKLSQLLFLSIL